MAGIIPNEGKQLVANLITINSAVDRGTNLELGLFLNPTIPTTITAADLLEPIGGGYARIILTDGSWTNTSGVGVYANQTFTATGSSYTGSIYGYFIVTTGTVPRIISIELLSGGPVTMAKNDTYTITPQITVS